MSKAKASCAGLCLDKGCWERKGPALSQMRVFDLITFCFPFKLPLNFQLSDKEQAFAFVTWQLWALSGKSLPNFLYLVFMRLTSTVVPKHTEYLFVLGRLYISASEFCTLVSGELASVASQRNLKNGRNLFSAGQRWTSPPGAWWTHNNHFAVKPGVFLS